MIDKIENKADVLAEREKVVRSSISKYTKSAINYIGTVASCLIMAIVVVILTTKLGVNQETSIKDLSMSFFVVLIGTYSVYLASSDSGMRKGYMTTDYTEAKKQRHTLIEKVKGIQPNHIDEYCKEYIKTELNDSKNRLLYPVKISEEDYKETYCKLSKKEIKALRKTGKLTEPQAKAIIAANKLKPIKLTKSMIYDENDEGQERSPLGTNPHAKKRKKSIIKFITVCCTSIVFSILACELIVEPSFEKFAETLAKVLPMVLQMFLGYKMGYDNIAMDTVSYINRQCEKLEDYLNKEHEGFYAFIGQEIGQDDSVNISINTETIVESA